MRKGCDQNLFTEACLKLHADDDEKQRIFKITDVKHCFYTSNCTRIKPHKCTYVSKRRTVSIVEFSNKIPAVSVTRQRNELLGKVRK
jgi:hypothetical protein